MSNNIIGKLDFPTNKIKIWGGLMIVKGWAFSENKNKLAIEVFIDDESVGKGTWGLPRFDVFKLHDTSASYESGFIARVGVKNIEFGEHNIKIIAKSNNQEKLIEEIKITIGKQESFDKPIPREPTPVGPPDIFKEVGEHYLNVFQQLVNLKKNDQVLEIGCGMGRMAMPLTNYLNNEGNYHGLDIVPEAIQFCQENITLKFPNFHFSLSDIYNKMYNPNGKSKASDYRFPFDDESFDFIFLASVFTHIILEDIENYLSEISRVLKKDGFCFITYFLYNEKILNKQSDELDFKYNFNGYRSRNSKIPEQAIEYEEKLIRELYPKNGLKIVEPIYYRDPKQKSFSSHQDFIIATKT